MEKQLLETLEKINSKLDEQKPHKENKWVDLAMRIAASVSTVGILAVFALFFTTIPKINTALEKLTWMREQDRSDIDKLLTYSSAPRFDLEKYNLHEAPKDRERSSNAAKLDILQVWKNEKDTIDSRQNYRIEKLEELSGFKKTFKGISE